MKKSELLRLLIINLILINTAFGQLISSDLKKCIDPNGSNKFHFLRVKPKDLNLDESKLLKEIYFDDFSKDSTTVFKLDDDMNLTSLVNEKTQLIVVKEKTQTFFFRILRNNNLQLSFLSADFSSKNAKFYFFCKSQNICII